MNNSNKKTIVSIVVLVILVIALTIFWQFYGSGKFGRNQSAQVINSQGQTENQPEPEMITALHQFSNGKHTIAGELNVPTPCHILNQDVSINSAVTPVQFNNSKR